MLNVGALNQKIIAQSVKTSAVRTEVPKSVDKKEKVSDNRNLKIAAAAVTSIAVAGIIIANRNKIGKLFKGKAEHVSGTNHVSPEGKKLPVNTPADNSKPLNNSSPASPPKETPAGNSVPENPVPKEDNLPKSDIDDLLDDNELDYKPHVPQYIDRIIPYDENAERMQAEAEAPIRAKLTEMFKRYREDKESAPEFHDYLMSNLIFPEHVSPKIKPDLRELEQADFDAVVSFLEQYQYNAKLRAGLDLSDVDEVKRLNSLIEEAEPLEQESFVYRGIRTRELWGEHKELEFAKDWEVGDTIKDRAFVSTSRSYDVDIAATDPKNLEERLQDCGYVMRIRLPKGTKGLDCRRCSMMDSDRGTNAVYILPPGAEFKIRAYNAPRRMIDCDYILPVNK